MVCEGHVRAKGAQWCVLESTSFMLGTMPPLCSHYAH